MEHGPKSWARKAIVALLLFPVGPIAATCCASSIKQINKDVAADAGARDAGARDAAPDVQQSTDWYFSPKDIKARNQAVIDHFTENMKTIMHVDPKDFKMDQPFHKPFTFRGVEFMFSFIFSIKEEVLEVQMQILGPPADNRMDLQNTLRIPIKRDRTKMILENAPEAMQEIKT